MITLQPRNQRIGDIIDQCARKQLPFDQACAAIAEMGFKTISVFEMVRSREDELRRKSPEGGLR